MNMIKAVRGGRESCSDLSWVFRLDRIGPRVAGVGSTGGPWVVVIAGDVDDVDDDSVCTTRLSGVTLDDNPTEKRKIGKIARKV